MEKYVGTGILELKGKDISVKLEISLNENYFYDFLGESDENIPMYEITREDIIKIKLKDIILKRNVKDKEEIIENKIIENLFISKISDSNKFKFIPRNGFVEMKRRKKREIPNVYSYSGISQSRITCQYDNIAILSDPWCEYKRVNIYKLNELSIDDKKIETIVSALQLLQGDYIKKSIEEFQEKIIFYIQGNMGKICSKTTSILKEPLYNNNFLYRVLSFLFNLDEENKKKWMRAFQIYVSYKNSNNIDLLIRLLQFFELFKNSSTSYKNNLIDNFSIENSEATFITKLRNDLVHEGLFLDESLNKNFSLLDENSNLKILLRKTDHNIKRVFLLAFYIEELVTKHIILNLPRKDKYAPQHIYPLQYIHPIHETEKNIEFYDFNKIYNEIIIS